jgi:hypothetical protein
MRGLLALVVGASIAVPCTAFAQMSDTDYCNALSKTYREVVASTATPDVTVPEAMSKCSTSPASSIPVLEKALRDNKVTLPKRT